MRRYLSIITIILLLAAGLIKCSKPVEDISRPALLITLKDDSGRLVRGASVRLYKNLSDSGITQLSDSTGVVLFSNLDTTLYYWLAKKGCKTNGVSQRTLNRALESGVVLYGFSILTETGVLKITSNSAESYKIVDSLSQFTTRVNKDTPYIAYRKVNTYVIRSAKVSTPALTKDTLITIRCSDTTSLRVPY